MGSAWRCLPAMHQFSYHPTQLDGTVAIRVFCNFFSLVEL
jgi:hypothetical protein